MAKTNAMSAGMDIFLGKPIFKAGIFKLLVEAELIEENWTNGWLPWLDQLDLTDF